MSNSFKHVPIFGLAGGSDKKDKRFANRALRNKVRMYIRMWRFDKIPMLRQVSNVYSFAKDGKRYWASAGKVEMAK